MDDSKAILFVSTSYGRIDERHPTGVWFEEFAVPYERFAEEGYLVAVASIKGGKVPVDPRSLPEAKESLSVQGPLAALQHTQRLMELDVTEYDAVFFPGGHGAMFDFPHNREVAELAAHCLSRGKAVAALCHGPAALIQAKNENGVSLVKGRMLTSFTDEEEREARLDGLMPFLLEDRLRGLGAEVRVAPNWRSHVVVDGNLVTGQNPQSSRAVAEALIQILA